MSIINVFAKVITEVAKRNMAKKDVKTADPVVFKEMTKEIESYEREEDPKATSAYVEYDSKRGWILES